MKLSKHLLMIPAIALIGGLPTGSAHAQSEQSTTIGIRGIVRTVCRVEFNQASAPVSGDTVDLGRMTQLCNNIDGYRVIMQHPAGLGGATVSIDGIEAPLSSGTETILVDSSNPAFRTNDVRLHLASGAASQLSLAFRIEPKGAVY